MMQISAKLDYTPTATKCLNSGRFIVKNKIMKRGSALSYMSRNTEHRNAKLLFGKETSLKKTKPIEGIKGSPYDNSEP